MKDNEVIVIGGTADCYAAAALLARAGASVCVVARDAEAAAPSLGPRLRHPAMPGPLAPAIGDSLWRALRLHRFLPQPRAGLPVTTIFAEDDVISTTRAIDDARASIFKRSAHDAPIVPDFARSMRRTDIAVAPLLDWIATRAAHGKSGAPFEDFDADIWQLSEMTSAARLCSAAAADVMHDYFRDPFVRTHFAASALLRAGIGASAPTSATALARAMSPLAEPTRYAGGYAGALAAFQKAALSEGVAIYSGSDVRIAHRDRRITGVTIDGGEEEIRGRVYLAFAPVMHRPHDAAAPVAARDGLLGGVIGDTSWLHLNVTLSASMDFAALGDDGGEGLYVVCGSLDEIDRAYGDAIAGKLPRQPVFEFAYAAPGGDRDGDDRRGKLHVRAPFAPARGPGDAVDDAHHKAFAGLIVDRLADCVPQIVTSSSPCEIVGADPFRPYPLIDEKRGDGEPRSSEPFLGRRGDFAPDRLLVRRADFEDSLGEAGARAAAYVMRAVFKKEAA